MSKRILIVADITYNPVKMFLDQTYKLAKGFIRTGHDVRLFSYCDALRQLSPLKSRSFSKLFFKSQVDKLLAQQVKSYRPHIVYMSFPKFMDDKTIRLVRYANPGTVVVGFDADPWPKLQGNRIETARELDILTATNDGRFLQDYRDGGVKFCVFMPNMCDPDTDHRYEVSKDWQSDILWTGKVEHHADKTDTFRKDLVEKLYGMKNCRIYGCCGRPQIGGLDYYYAISGARIGVNVNAYSSVKFCHSDRLTHYLSCGTFVIARRMVDSVGLFEDNVHLKYFDSVEEFFELTDWFLKNEKERKKIADAGMKWMHEQFNSVKIAGYIIDLVEKGSYKAPWNS